MSNSIKSRLPFTLLFLSLVALAIFINLPKEAEQKKMRGYVVNVKLEAAELAEFKDQVEAIGTTQANEQILVTSKNSDIVDEVLFTDGQIVRKNDILVILNNQEENARIDELEANLAESVSQLKRFQDLLTKKATSSAEVEQQDAKTKAITAQLTIAKTKLAELTIRAPFNGVLGFREISKGAYIKSGDVITSLDDLSVIKVDFSIPERFLTTIKVGQIITAVNSAYKSEEFIGKITSIDPRIDNITRTVKIRAEIPNADFKLRPGMLLNILIERRVDTVLLIPENAIIPIEDKHYVFVINEEKASRIQVTVGRRKPGIVEITSGLTQGQQVVIEGALKLRDGSKVKVLEN